MAWLVTVRRFDWALMLATLLLLCIGLIILFAINFKDPSLAQDFSPMRQVLHAAAGVGLMFFVARLDYKLWLRLGKFWYVLGIGLLLLVMVAGTEALGAVRALDLGIIAFQPSEFVKIGVIMTLGAYFVRMSEQMARWQNLLLSIAIAGVPALLIAVQPDLGSAIVIVFLWGAMVLASSAKRWHLLALLAAILMLIPLVYGQLQTYQKERINSFLNPQTDPQGSGYNVNQATIAIGSGQIFGKGLGSGTQSQLNFIPSQHTDFVFAVTAEKLGLLGGLLVISLFFTLLWRGLVIAANSGEKFGQMLALGLSAMFFIHVVVNIGMNLGIMPVTGIPLPFLSYGGTNLIISLVGIGLLQSVRLHQADLEFKT